MKWTASLFFSFIFAVSTQAFHSPRSFPPPPESLARRDKASWLCCAVPCPAETREAHGSLLRCLRLKPEQLEGTPSQKPRSCTFPANICMIAATGVDVPLLALRPPRMAVEPNARETNMVIICPMRWRDGCVDLDAGMYCMVFATPCPVIGNDVARFLLSLPACVANK